VKLYCFGIVAFALRRDCPDKPEKGSSVFRFSSAIAFGGADGASRSQIPIFSRFLSENADAKRIAFGFGEFPFLGPDMRSLRYSAFSQENDAAVQFDVMGTFEIVIGFDSIKFSIWSRFSQDISRGYRPASPFCSVSDPLRRGFVRSIRLCF